MVFNSNFYSVVKLQLDVFLPVAMYVRSSSYKCYAYLGHHTKKILSLETTFYYRCRRFICIECSKKEALY